jgi:hypothetical protein
MEAYMRVCVCVCVCVCLSLIHVSYSSLTNVSYEIFKRFDGIIKSQITTHLNTANNI